jgi:hypothetical protein
VIASINKLAMRGERIRSMWQSLILYVLSSGPAFAVLDRDTFVACYPPLVQFEKHTTLGKPLKDYWIFCDELFLSDEAREIQRNLGIYDF